MEHELIFAGIIRSLVVTVRLIVLAISLALVPCAVTAAELVVDVVGLSGDELTNVENILSIARLAKPDGLLAKLKSDRLTDIGDVPRARIERLHRAAPTEIVQALQPFGYYNPDIKSSLKLTDDVWRATYTVQPGSPVVIQSLSIEIVGPGAADVELQQIKLNTAMAVQQRLLHQQYTATKSALLGTAVERGYLDANFTKSVLKINSAALSADVELLLDTGQQYHFGNIQIEQSILSDAVIQRLVPIKEGDIYNADQLVALQLALSDSDYFDRVEITADRETAIDYRVPVIVEVTARKPQKYTFGTGYGTDTGPRIKVGAVFRRVNQRGHNIHTDLLLSTVKNSLSLQYVIPMGNAGKDSLRFLSSVEKENIGDGQAQRLKLGSNYNDTWHSLQRRLYLHYLRENFTLGSVDKIVTFVIPGVNLSFTKADNILNPTDGYSWFVDVHGGHSALGSDTTFLQGRAVGQLVRSLGTRARLLGRLEVGATDVDSFADLPLSERFFAGGDRSVRGYAYQSLSPLDSDGNTTGGRYLGSASLEADYLFYNDFGAAIFMDAGNVADSASFQWKRAVGTGARWRSPVGMFRLDIAIPLDNDSSSYRIHISIGADL